MGHPGPLPVINKEAVRSVLRFGVAVGGELADYTEFDRKNYFYPDIPKGYQISQYKYPLVRGGSIAGIPLTRIHLEEDTARSLHDRNDQIPNPKSQINSKLEIQNSEFSLVDFNRAGVPLMELVTEPEIHDAETASKFAREFQLILQYLSIGEANMEKGEMRVEANISISRFDLGNSEKVEPLGTKVEVKNLNSFKSVEKAIKYEFERQKTLLERGDKVVQETRGWDEDKEETFSQRIKEESHDYRYFPDPDLPKLFISEIEDFNQEVLRNSLPELPEESRQRFRDLGIKEEDIEVYIYNKEKSELLEATIEYLENMDQNRLASNYLITDIKTSLDPKSFAEVVLLVYREEISSRAAKDIIKILEQSGGNPTEIVRERNLTQISDRELLKSYVEEARKENPDAPDQFLVGQAMKKSGGRANPKILQELIIEVTDH